MPMFVRYIQKKYTIAIWWTEPNHRARNSWIICSVVHGFFLGDELMIHWRQSSYTSLDINVLNPQLVRLTGLSFWLSASDCSAIRPSISGTRYFLRSLIARLFLVIIAATSLRLSQHRSNTGVGNPYGASKSGVIWSTSALTKASSGNWIAAFRYSGLAAVRIYEYNAS